MNRGEGTLSHDDEEKRTLASILTPKMKTEKED